MATMRNASRPSRRVMTNAWSTFRYYLAKSDRSSRPSGLPHNVRMARTLCFCLLVVLSMTGLADQRALPKAILIDGHNDYPWALREHDPARDLDKLDISKPQP